MVAWQLTLSAAHHMLAEGAPLNVALNALCSKLHPGRGKKTTAAPASEHTVTGVSKVMRASVSSELAVTPDPTSYDAVPLHGWHKRVGKMAVRSCMQQATLKDEPPCICGIRHPASDPALPTQQVPVQSMRVTGTASVLQQCIPQPSLHAPPNDTG